MKAGYDEHHGQEKKPICYVLRLGCGHRERLWCGDGLGEQQMRWLQILLVPPAESWRHAQHCQLDRQLYPRQSQRQQACGGLAGELRQAFLAGALRGG